VAKLRKIKEKPLSLQLIYDLLRQTDKESRILAGKNSKQLKGEMI